MLIKSILTGIFIMFLLACDFNKNEVDKEVVSIGNTTLMESDLINEGLQLDSSLHTQGFITRWVKKQLILDQAELLSEEELEVNIDDLVNKYHQNLLLAYYEKYLVQTQLDTSILESELKAYYNEHLEEFSLDHKIIKCRFIHVDKSNDQKKSITNLIKSTSDLDIAKTQAFCNNNAKFCLLPFDKWYNWKEIEHHFPDGIHLNKKDIGKSVRSVNKNDIYYIYLIDYLSYKDQAPYTYIKSQARKAILFQRKKKIIEDRKEELYNNALKDNRIKIF